MKKEFMKKSWSIVLALGVVLLLAGGIFIACQKEAGITAEEKMQDQGVEYPIPENAVVFTTEVRILKEGEFGWFDTKETGIPVWFGGAVAYYLPFDIKYFERYYNLLKGEPNQEYNILRITLDVDRVNPETGAIPIIKIELPSSVEKRVEEKRLRSSRESSQIEMRSSLMEIMSLNQAKQFFNQFKQAACSVSPQCPCLTFQYAVDGCYARAHYMRKLMLDAGFDSKKVFVWATTSKLQAETTIGCCNWWYWHVAPLVFVDMGNSTQQMVLDPGLFNSPVSLHTWLNKVRTTCKGMPRATISYEIRSSDIYRLPDERDDNYSHTYMTLDNYSTLSGCN